MVYSVEIGEMLVVDISGFIFATWKDNDIRTNEYLEKGSLVVVVNNKIVQKFINITSGSASGWMHVASVVNLEGHAAAG